MTTITIHIEDAEDGVLIVSEPPAQDLVELLRSTRTLTPAQRLGCVAWRAIAEESMKLGAISGPAQ